MGYFHHTRAGLVALVLAGVAGVIADAFGGAGAVAWSAIVVGILGLVGMEVFERWRTRRRSERTTGAREPSGPALTPHQLRGLTKLAEEAQRERERTVRGLSAIGHLLNPDPPGPEAKAKEKEEGEGE